MTGPSSGGTNSDWLNADAILSSTSDGYWQADLESGRHFESQRLQVLLGLNEDGQKRERPALDPDWVHPEDRQRVFGDYELMVQQGRDEVSHEFRLRTQSGTWLWVQGRTRVLERGADGRPRLLCGWISDISRRRQLEQTLGALLERRQAATVADYLREALSQLTAVLGIRFAHIGLLTPDGEYVQTEVVVRDGAVVPNFRYRLQGSPCAFMSQEPVCVYTHGVQDLFPEDRGLKMLGVESYLGIALKSKRNETQDHFLP